MKLLQGSTGWARIIDSTLMVFLFRGFRQMPLSCPHPSRELPRDFCAINHCVRESLITEALEIKIYNRMNTKVLLGCSQGFMLEGISE